VFPVAPPPKRAPAEFLQVSRAASWVKQARAVPRHPCRFPAVPLLRQAPMALPLSSPTALQPRPDLAV